MTDPISFTSSTPRFSFPFLFAGQAQKEFFVNEAYALADMLLHTAIEGTADNPPAVLQEGECWLVGSTPTAEWDGHPGELACLQSGNWIFAIPRDGMNILDRSTGQKIHYSNGWQVAAPVPSPSGGTVVDVEARTAVAGLISALISAGVIPDA